MEGKQAAVSEELGKKDTTRIYTTRTPMSRRLLYIYHGSATSLVHLGLTGVRLREGISTGRAISADGPLPEARRSAGGDRTLLCISPPRSARHATAHVISDGSRSLSAALTGANGEHACMGTNRVRF
ncbi:hypothetical protein MRX96_035050 [Rhipicephalus microplus]